jgi:ABC-type glycerol-3-phosphate transport system substrate-binding protein
MSFAMQASFGQDPSLSMVDGKYVASFNNPSMVKAFTLWKELYDAGYMPTSLAWGNVPQVQDFSAGKVVMTIADGGTLSWMNDNMGSFPGVEKFDLSDVGVGRLPDGGGNGSLGGGNMWMYNANATPESLSAAVAWNLWRDFDLAAYEQDLKIRSESGAVIGYPEVQIFGGEYGAQRAEILAKYANAPTENYANYNESAVVVMGEPAVKANEMKDALGLALQTILTTKDADVQAILDAAVATFQETVLDVME